jgi:hypothetical protein
VSSSLTLKENIRLSKQNSFHELIISNNFAIHIIA